MSLSQKPGVEFLNNVQSENSIKTNKELLAQKNAASAASKSVPTTGHESVTNGQPYANIEEKVAQLSLQLNQVFVKPYLQQALDYLKQSKNDSVNSYNTLADQIASEIKIITQTVQNVNGKLVNAQNTINRTQEIIRNKYSNASEEEISSGQINLEYEYKLVGDNYEVSLQLSQEISNYKARITSLTSLQGMLDQSMVPFISRLQLEIDNLELLVHNFDSSDYADILAKKQGINAGEKYLPLNTFKGRSEELNNMTSEVMSSKTEIQKPNLQEMHRQEDVNQQSINTFVQENRIQTAVNQAPANQNVNANVNNTNVNNTTVQQQAHPQAEQNVNLKQQQPTFTDSALSRQEQKMMRRLREQQMQLEQTMRMNKMIFEYNKSIDEMIKTQKEYEKQIIAHETKETVIEPSPIKTSRLFGPGPKTVNINPINSNNDQQTNDEGAQLVNKNLMGKSIRVVR